MRWRIGKWLPLGVALSSTASASRTVDVPATLAERSALREAAHWVSDAPGSPRQYDYVMTAKLRLLLFWVGKDDVGGGYIRFGEGMSSPPQESIQVLFGSDPDKAPRRINRWGAATEIVEPDPESKLAVRSSAFFGFMKASEGDTVSDMEGELNAERIGGRHLFRASLTRVEPTGVVSVAIPFYSDRDFNLHELAEAKGMVLSRLEEEEDNPRRLRRNAQGCESSSGFLFTIKKMVDEALSGKKAPYSTCYVHNAHLYTATLTNVEPVAEKSVALSFENGEKIAASYRNLLRVHFVVVNQETNEKTPFELFLGTSGPLRGVPIQIVHQPKWWFKVVLTLKAPA